MKMVCIGRIPKNRSTSTKWFKSKEWKHQTFEGNRICKSSTIHIISIAKPFREFVTKLFIFCFVSFFTCENRAPEFRCQDNGWWVCFFRNLIIIFLHLFRYGSDYVDVNIPSGSGTAPGKIRNRRKTYGAPTYNAYVYFDIHESYNQSMT